MTTFGLFKDIRHDHSTNLKVSLKLNSVIYRFSKWQIVHGGQITKGTWCLTKSRGYAVSSPSEV